MTTPIGATTSAYGTSGAAGTGGGAAGPTARNDSLGKDAFLQLLVAQLRYQDPTKPVDSSEFMAQTAQFTSVEKLEQLVAAQATQQRLQAATLVGQHVTWLATDGTPRSGVVDFVRMDPDAQPLAQVGTDAVPLSEITQIGRPTPAA